MGPDEIRQARQALGLSCVRLGALAGVSEATVRKLETGRDVGALARARVIAALQDRPDRAQGRLVTWHPADPATASDRLGAFAIRQALAPPAGHATLDTLDAMRPWVLELRCRCGRVGRQPVADLLLRHGPRARLPAVVARMRCQDCGSLPSEAALTDPGLNALPA